MTPPTPDAHAHADRDQLYERLSDLVDDRLPSDQRATLERALDEDPALRRELDDLRDTVAVLHHLPPAQAPEDFLRAVQSRIRRRSQGRYFGVGAPSYRLQVEAVFNVLLIALLFALYLLATPAPDPPPVPLGPAAAGQTAPPAPAETPPSAPGG